MIEINPKNFIGMGVLVEIVDMPIEQIKPYKKNPRKNEKAIPEVVKSLKEFGFRQPLVVDSNMVLIAGLRMQTQLKREDFTGDRRSLLTLKE